MTASWVAASVRARALSRRRIGAAGARGLVTHGGLRAAVDTLAASPYGHGVRGGDGLAAVQHGVAATLLWHVRVLAGWVPRGDARLLRVLAGGFEIANVDERLRALGGLPADRPFVLGTLGVISDRLAGATSVSDVRALLAASAWGDPGGDTERAIRVGMRLAWARRAAATVPSAEPWAAGAAALLVAREVLLESFRPEESLLRQAAPLLDRGWSEARTLASLRGSLPPAAAWALAGATDPHALWQAESRWWARVEHDGFALLRRPVGSSDPVVGAVAVLAADAWRVRAALEAAARGASTATVALEAFDAVA